MLEQHLLGEIVWIGFKRHGDGKFTRYKAVSHDGKWVAVDSERNDSLPSFARDFKIMIGNALRLAINPLKRK